MALLCDVPNMMKRGSVKLSWLRERFAVIAEDASAEVVRRHARAYLLHLLGCTIFNDKTENSAPLMYLPLLEDLDRATRYSWGGATLSYLYRQLSIACKTDAKAICGLLTLLQIVSPERDVDILIGVDILHILYRYGIVGQITSYHRMRRLLILVEWSIWLGIGLSLGGTLVGQDDISDSTQSRFIAMQMYIDGVLSNVQRTDSSTSHAGPSEPCADTPQQPDDAGPSHYMM
ncbi:hypothetical protein Taro_006067 [Colocasia esculenta]|uniref:Aminotransferase-like plant mobile domain-containing protein n=1 Tax=Colocasia esculenta TaxID=4460 RepID=A0A843TRP7_COLES|nr:hypothetical protein [Colocasia esculenta]